MSHELTSSFESEVIQRSHEVPVLVDFWADWCGPCLMFGPILERSVEAAAGRWELVKVNTERHPDLAQRHGIRSLPTIRLFVNGVSAAEQLGALSEAGLKQWLDRHLPSRHAAALVAAEAKLKSGDFSTASFSADAVLAEEPGNDQALYLKARSALALDPAAVVAIANAIPASSPFSEKTGPLKELAKILLAPPAEEGKGAIPCANAIAAIRRLDWDAACAALLELLERDRHYGYDLAAKALKQIFLLLGPRDAITTRHQPRFASLLFS
jgi:putative thioredoxin